VRSGADDAAISDFVAGIWGQRADRYSEERAGILASGAAHNKIEMSYIGG
jgi:cyclic pyranopterin phosphate synthase